MQRHSQFILSLALAFVGWPALASAAVPEKLEYNRDIRPIFNEYCFSCHGPDSASRQADLRLDKRDTAVSMKAIVPGTPAKSSVVERIMSTDPEEGGVMPPVKTKKKLTDEQKQILTRWIEQGAEYQPHWSFIAPVKPALPAVKNAAWVRNPIDAFVLAKLEANGLSPAPEADRRTLARRLSLDLTGLPPEPALVERFVNDKAENAYEKLVDELLQSNAWGEHRGRYWLDAARYGDTHGIHIDNYREMWAYRDWVIAALNANMPFDQFTIEQLAGDLLPNRTLDQQVATGFNRCNITTSEGGAIPEEYSVLYMKDRTETVAQVWLGMSANCCTCHDHKFDPYTQKDFYSMAAFFNNTTQAAMDGNIQNTPPTIKITRAEDRPRFTAIDGELAAAKKTLADREAAARVEHDKWIASAKPELATPPMPQEGLKFYAPLSEGDGKVVHVEVDGQPRALTVATPVSWEPAKAAPKAFKGQGGAVAVPEVGDFDAQQAFTCGAWVKIPKGNETGSVVARMDDKNDYRGWDMWIQGGKLGTHLIHKWNEDAIKVVSKQALKPNVWTHVLISYDGSKTAAGVKLFIDGVLQPADIEANALKNTMRTTVPFKVGTRNTSSPLAGLSLHDLRLYGRVLPDAEVQQLAKSNRVGALLAKPADQRNDAEKKEIFQWWLATNDKSFQDATTKLAALEKERVDITSRGTETHVMQERKEEAMAFILYRGEYDKRKDKLTPATPASLPPMPAEMPKNRLGFAEWLLRPEHPLTTRVTVNRFWQELFGLGIVRTTGDFGVAGELPANQELLDYLAVDFRENKWDVKRLYKLMVMSNTYRQSAVVTPEKLQRDPQNRFLSRGPRFRMDAEMVRDYALAASGILSRKIGGPSVRPYQPDGVWEAVAMSNSNTRNYKRDTGESLYRRSMYTFWKRAAPPASLDIFNAPSRETCTTRRERTNTPLQALVTLNDPQYIEAARYLAERTLKEGGADNPSRFDFLARRLLSRPLRPEEQKVIETSLADLVAHYQSQPEEAKQLLTVGEFKSDASLPPAVLAGYTMLTNELMNLDEVLNK